MAVNKPGLLEQYIEYWVKIVIIGEDADGGTIIALYAPDLEAEPEIIGSFDDLPDLYDLAVARYENWGKAFNLEYAAMPKVSTTAALWTVNTIGFLKVVSSTFYTTVKEWRKREWFPWYVRKVIKENRAVRAKRKRPRLKKQGLGPE